MTTKMTDPEIIEHLESLSTKMNVIDATVMEARFSDEEYEALSQVTELYRFFNLNVK